MNKDYLFLKNLSSLLDSGYGIKDALDICNQILKHKAIQDIILKLEHGYSIEESLIESDISHLFIEYFSFFKNKNCLSEAIKKSLDICISQQDYQNQLKTKLSYPLILLVFLLVFSIFVVFVLLPNVNNLFISFGIKKTLFINIIFIFFHIIPIFIIAISIILSHLVFRLLKALKRKKFKVIEQYLRFPLIKQVLQKYFSLKFAVYYNELLKEEIDSATIIRTLNNQMSDSDIKIVLYEMNNRMNEGEALENILEDFEYLDSLFLTFFKMYIKNPTQYQSINHYIDLTYDLIDVWIAKFLKFFIPSIYGFVGLFVITIYVSIIIPMMNVISEI